MHQNTPADLRSFTVATGVLAGNASYEQLCIQYEHAYADYTCECCLQVGVEDDEGLVAIFRNNSRGA